MRPRATAITFVLPKKSLLWGGGGGLVCCFFDRGSKIRKGDGGEGGVNYLLSDNCVRTSLRYVLRMLWTLKT